MYNVLLHELGHGHMLNHSLLLGGAPSSGQYVVYHDLTLVSDNTIKNDDQTGGLKVVPNSAQVVQGCSAGFIPVTKIAGCGDECLATATKNIKQNIKFELFPNPTEGFFKVSFVKPISDFEVKIYNHAGTLIQEETIVKRVSEWGNKTELNRGLYILKLIGKEQQIISKILVL